MASTIKEVLAWIVPPVFQCLFNPGSFSFNAFITSSVRLRRLSFLTIIQPLAICAHGFGTYNPASDPIIIF